MVGLPLLLDGRRAATHWLHAPLLAARYPQVVVEPDPIFVRDGNVWSSAGVTTGIDLALALIEQDAGRHDQKECPVPGQMQELDHELGNL